jgi:hypothetical protein
MIPLSTKAERDKAINDLGEALAAERASGKPVDDSWTNDLPSDPSPSEGEETSVTFVKKSKSGN